MPNEKQQSTKDRCPDCGNTGLKSDEKLVTTICPCPAGKARDRANDSLWD